MSNMNKIPLHSPKSPRPSKAEDTAASKSAASQHSPTATKRPALNRTNPQSSSATPGALPETASESYDEDTTESEMSDSKEGMEDMQSMGNTLRRDTPSPDELEVERLRQLQMKVLQKQHRTHVRDSPGGSPRGTGARRVSPIKEEAPPGMSPTLEGAFSSPLPTAHTTSTESTESGKTVRASVPPTPANVPIRTPSYPFPTVPNTPRGWSTSFHQPFTALSPTVSAMYHQKDHVVPRDSLASESSTPAASATPFAPPGKTDQGAAMEDPRFPSPNMYELVLRLGSEPGLPAWWSTVTMILQDWYGVERATLAVPADTSDIENVPWGQKTTFNAETQEERPSASRYSNISKMQKERTESSDSDSHEERPSSLAPEMRPKLSMRHSFAGHERYKKDPSSVEPVTSIPIRPRGPLRTASHAPQSMMRREHPLRQVSPAPFDGPKESNLKASTFSDPDFSSVGGDINVAPLTAVFPVLRALDHEPDALIDNAGINRVLERGRLVTLTRDYTPSLNASRKNSSSSEQGESNVKPGGKHVTIAPQDIHKTTGPKSRSTMASRAGNIDPGESKILPRYEEYEQYPSSPWAQSPAPSPAIQSDANENPFFAAATIDEETFNPSGSSQDYSQFGLVEAIGVDKASTVTHMPLIHPTLSQIMQPPDSKDTPSHTPTLSRRQSDLSQQTISAKSDYLKKAPIAILSTLSPIVPYPQNLTTSLKLLGPHLATSFYNAWQYTNAQAQASGLRQRRFQSAHQVGFAPVSDQETLDDFLTLDIEQISYSAAGSVTSPSDYSSRSRQSPGGSIGGTPGWDPSTVGLSSKQSVGGTPAHLGAEGIDSYFDAKKKTSTAATSPAPLSTHDHGNRRSEKRTTKRVSVSTVPEDLEENTITPRNDKNSSRTTGQDDLSGQATSPRRPRMISTPSLPGPDRRPHSFLHSYGADFASSFQSLPAATTPKARTPAGHPGHMRTPSSQESHDMPPPSESLLRTIIDSLPVQIFTALPTTGALTWVNSKFLVYRGQESRQVLQEPWDAIHPDDREAYLEQWNKSLRTGQQLQQKVRLQRFDGYYRWFYVRVAPLKNKRQQIVHWIGTNMDFHEQHLAEVNSARQQETAASEAKYRALANSSPQVVFVVSNRRGLTFCNSQWISYSGQSEAQAHGTGFLEHVHPDDVPKCKLPEMNEDGTYPLNVPTSVPPDHARQESSASDDSSETERAVTSPGSATPQTLEMPQAKLSKLAGTGILKVSKDAHGRASYSTEVRLRNKDGEYRWHLVRILLEKALASSDDDDEETWYGSATDINDHKLLEQTLKETMDAKTRFLSNMSHEIRTPLNGISGMVNFLLDSVLNSEQLEHVNIIKASTDSLLNLINDILDLSKVEAGMIKLSMDWLHIPSLLEEVNDLNMGLAIQKGLELNYLVEEGLPSMVKGDKFRIRQVLLNIVGNAIKFTQKGEVCIRCRPNPTDKLNENETMIRFEVIDTGRGFSEDEAKYLFKRFSQIDASSTRQHGGTGLGLAISMQFVELHGGKMDARSVPGKGSTFFFTIKFNTPSEEDHPLSEAATPSTSVIDPTAAKTASPMPVQSILEKKPSVKDAIAGARKERIGSMSSDGDLVKSPVPSLPSSERSRESPSISSAGSSDPSVTGRSSLRSERSSASSFIPDITKDPQMQLALPIKRDDSDESSESLQSNETARPPPIQRSLSPLGSNLQPPMYSILVVCPLAFSREATVRHIKMTLPNGIPHQITAQPSVFEAQKMIGGDDPVLFTHIVLVLKETSEVIAIMDQVFNSTPHIATSIVVISDPAQKKEIMKDAPSYDFNKLTIDRRLRFIYRPLKPSKFAVIFDPQKERESSTDRNQDSAQQVVVNQKLVFEDLKRRLSNKGHRVLLVEDNQINQTVILKFLAKVSMETETVLDGVQCTEKVFSKPHGYYSIILCDLHMPNKDGYQACKEIRKWEKKNRYGRLPIIALSANVLGDVYAKCVEAGFNSYVTKPVEFKELSLVLTKFLDPEDPNALPDFMRLRK